MRPIRLLVSPQREEGMIEVYAFFYIIRIV